jgi:hypothetical protein
LAEPILRGRKLEKGPDEGSIPNHIDLTAKTHVHHAVQSTVEIPTPEAVTATTELTQQQKKPQRQSLRNLCACAGLLFLALGDSNGKDVLCIPKDEIIAIPKNTSCIIVPCNALLLDIISTPSQELLENLRSRG